MSCLIALIGIFTFCYVCCNGVRWDGLKVKFGEFIDMPRTVTDALAAGFTKRGRCNVNAGWKGVRYVKGNDRTLILLFDRKGYIAGVQYSIPKISENGYPSTSLQSYFISDGDYWVTTAYFVHPAKICTKGRSKNQFDRTGTGPDLYIQNSTSPASSIKIPRSEVGLESTQWTEGKCFPKMGKHYWWNMYESIPCDYLAPFFLLYNKGHLLAFGMAFVTNLTTSMCERPSQPSYKLFMEPVPTCLLGSSVISTLHIYFTKNIDQITC